MNKRLVVGGIVAVAAAAIVALVVVRGGIGPARVGGSIPEVAIGGPFTLTSHTGETLSDTDFRGRFMLIYFGYTYCPDVCPTALTVMADALDLLGDDARKITPVMVSIDPERDTPEQLAEYVPHFHERLVALTGTTRQVADAAKAYRVYFAKAQEEGQDPADYLVDHTSVVYLMGPDGKFRVHFGHTVKATEMAERIKEHL